MTKIETRGQLGGREESPGCWRRGVRSRRGGRISEEETGPGVRGRGRLGGERGCLLSGVQGGGGEVLQGGPKGLPEVLQAGGGIYIL